MDNYPNSYEQFLKLHKTSGSESVSESEFYKEGYLSLVVLMESSMQKLHNLESKNKMLMEENKRNEEEVEKFILDIGNAEIQLKELKNNNETLKNKIENTISENEYLKSKIAKLEEDNRKMITLKQIDQLMETKFAKFENRIAKGLLNFSVSSGVSQNIIIEEHHDSASQSSIVASSLPIKDHLYDEFTNLNLKQCTEWWCPVHSNFEVLVKTVKPTSLEDQNLIKKAKSRFAYWSKGDTVRCCTIDRKRQIPPKTFVLPSCWPTVMPNDMDKLSNSFSKL